MTEVKKSRFIKNLTKSHKEIKETRAKRIARQVEMAQDALIRAIESRVMDAEAKLEELEDLSPTSTTSLQISKGDFDAKTWVEEMQATQIAVAEAEIELGIAKATKEKYFSV